MKYLRYNFNVRSMEMYTTSSDMKKVHHVFVNFERIFQVDTSEYWYKCRKCGHEINGDYKIICRGDDGRMRVESPTNDRYAIDKAWRHVCLDKK